jgi:glycosyltransferase involved in cell wall biosynthesis
LSDGLQVLAIEPYFGLSHRIFLEGFQRYSRHRVEIWQLPPRKWKWRMRGAAYHFAERAAQAPAGFEPDVVLASDFLNLADWRALSPPRFRTVPCLLYFHENQVAYPLSEQAPVDHHYGWINLSSALAAERVLFNSAYHREQFLSEIDGVLSRMPDHVPEGMTVRLRAKSSVFPVAIDFEPHEKFLRSRPSWNSASPVILWNHRWEFDKNPAAFVAALLDLRRRGVEFRVVICGESFGKECEPFEAARRELGDRILQLGFLPDHDDYLRAVSRCDVVVSTARHEFFGVSVVEAMYLGCLPVLPNALSYPEIVPPHLHPLFLYKSADDLADFLAEFLANPPLGFAAELHDAVARFHWKPLAPQMDGVLDELAEAAGAHRGGGGSAERPRMAFNAPPSPSSAQPRGCLPALEGP